MFDIILRYLIEKKDIKKRQIKKIRNKRCNKLKNKKKYDIYMKIKLLEIEMYKYCNNELL